MIAPKKHADRKTIRRRMLALIEAGFDSRSPSAPEEGWAASADPLNWRRSTGECVRSSSGLLWEAYDIARRPDHIGQPIWACHYWESAEEAMLAIDMCRASRVRASDPVAPPLGGWLATASAANVARLEAGRAKCRCGYRGTWTLAHRHSSDTRLSASCAHHGWPCGGDGEPLEGEAMAMVREACRAGLASEIDRWLDGRGGYEVLIGELTWGARCSRLWGAHHFAESIREVRDAIRSSHGCRD